MGKRKSNLYFSSSESLPNRNSQSNSTSQSASNSQLSSLCKLISDKKFKSSETFLEDSPSQLSGSKRIDRQYSVDEINRLSGEDLEEILMSDDSPPKNTNTLSKSFITDDITVIFNSSRSSKSITGHLESEPGINVDLSSSDDCIDSIVAEFNSDTNSNRSLDKSPKLNVASDNTIVNLHKQDELFDTSNFQSLSRSFSVEKFKSSESSLKDSQHQSSELKQINKVYSVDDIKRMTKEELEKMLISRVANDSLFPWRVSKKVGTNTSFSINLNSSYDCNSEKKRLDSELDEMVISSDSESEKSLTMILNEKSLESPSSNVKTIEIPTKDNSSCQIDLNDGIENNSNAVVTLLENTPSNTLPVDGMVLTNVCGTLDPKTKDYYIPALEPELILNMPVIFLSDQNITLNKQVSAVGSIGEHNQEPDVDNLISNNCNSKSCNDSTEADVVYDTAPFYSNSDANSNYDQQTNASGCSNSRPLSTGSNENLNEVQKCLRSRLNSISMNRALVYKGPVTAFGECTELRNNALRNKILRIFSRLLVQATNNQPLLLILRNNTDWSNSVFENKIVKLKRRGKFSIIRSDSPKFNLIIYLLGKMSAMVQNNITCTQREVHYLIKHFLGQYCQISSTLNNISCMLNIEPWYLPIKSTSKGLVYGALTIFTSDGDVLNCSPCGGTIIPYNLIKITKIISEAYFIMVVEKDTVFKKMIQEDVPNKFTRPFILVTGKGCPDVNTRLFLRILRQHLRIPVFILVDADPCGIDIMLTYKHGSLSMSHVNTYLADPSMQWLGVLPSEIIPLGFERLLLKKYDRGRALQILNRPYMDEDTVIKKELQVLLDNNFKAEIEGFQMGDSSLSDFYLQNKLCNKNFF